MSLYRVKQVGTRLVTDTGVDFDESGYSRFKHGDGVMAVRYGRALAARLLVAVPDFAKPDDRIVIASAPYKYLPTASHALALGVRRVVNAALAGSGRRPAEIGALRMSRVDSANYARLGTASRGDLLSRANLHVDAAEFTGRHVVLVDDARITGLAEAAATELVTAAGARSVTALYVVRIAGSFCPDIEDRMNHAFVRDLQSLLRVYRSGRFVLNIRTVKFLLGWPDRDELDRFFRRLTAAELSEIHTAARRTGPDFTRCYAESLRRLRVALLRTAAEGGGPPGSVPGRGVVRGGSCA